MITYTGRRSLIGTLANNTTSSFLDTMDILMNESELRLCSMKDWPFLEDTFSVTTEASTQFYDIPGLCERVKSAFITISSTNYTIQVVHSREEWDMLNQSSQTSNIPQYCFVFEGQIGFFPTPSTSSYTITLVGKRRAKGLSLADYTTGSIVSVANGGTAVVGTGTTWTAKMAGLWIKITDSNTANTGDGHWYEIESVGSATTLTLKRPYGGSSISAGTAAYTIGQVSALHEPYHLIPIYDALEVHFFSQKPESDRSNLYARKSAELLAQLNADAGMKSGSVVLDEGYDCEA